ncbi:MAG: AAA family ATPase [Dechloromonas sp.]|uniref:ExeA family protein n=1 Tax=Azonexaceae TaxID=2008795 RepID=UPI001CF8A8E4|nr:MULTISPECIES: AAA family ATPase [Azonexaceae]MBT9519973.1 AAA family ATPase [Dechloromonas sp.]UCV23922.1 AAA family ATPase [Ferribacterium limneticum]
MYLDHFGLSELPFGITPDTSYTVITRSHQEALNTLLVALNSGEGFIKITGEVGTGKTLLCRRLLQALPEGSVSAYLPNPYLAPRTLQLALAEELGLAVSADSDDYHLLQSINRALLDHAAADRQVVVCIDEAQAMPLETLESLRLLSNLETEKRKLLQIVLFGQPELDRKLAEPSVRQLLQRIAFHYRIGGLAREEVANYLAHRLRVAGYRGEDVFGPRAVRSLHKASRGTPRLLNILAHKSLLAVFGEGKHAVRPGHVRRAAADTEGAAAAGWW